MAQNLASQLFAGELLAQGNQALTRGITPKSGPNRSS
jgi:hypothetical protein